MTHVVELVALVFCAGWLVWVVRKVWKEGGE